jgi:hypothetical protein
MGPFLAAALTLLAFGGTVAGVAAGGPTGRQDRAQSLQRCVDRWNQMRMTLLGTVASVRARPRCEVELAYSFRLSTGSCAAAQVYRGAPRTCVDRRSSFLCVLNQFGAYACPTHADTTHVRRWNAIFRGHHLVLKHPPAVMPRTPLPGWARRYPYRDGFIQPWTSADHLRSGLTLVGQYGGKCSQTSELTTATTALRCGFTRRGFLYLLDPCFAQKPTWRRGGGLGACETAPGSATFRRFLITGSAGP